jgi:NitT/TauT family transport system permease protein
MATGSAAPPGRVPVLSREDALCQRELRAARVRQRRQRVLVTACQVALLAVVLGAWAWASGRVVDRLFFSDPASIGKAFWRMLVTGELWYHLRFTLTETLLGYLSGVSLGLAGAVAVALLPASEPIVRPFVMLFYATPKIALAPLIVMWFGLGIFPKVVLAATFVFFVVFLNTVAGIASVSPGLTSIARVMGATPLRLFAKVVLPSAMPFIVAALRITIPAALIGAVVGEFISSNRGVGYLISAASSRYRTADVFGGILSLMVVVLVMDMAVTAFERAWLRWAPPDRGPLG